jgi:hypothetical protein
MGMALFSKDTMTAEERGQALLEGKALNRVPFILQAHQLNQKEEKNG